MVSSIPSSSPSIASAPVSRRDVVRLGGVGLAAFTALVSGGRYASSAERVVAAAVLPAAQASGQFVIGTWTEPATLLSGAPVSGASYQQIQGIIANGLTRLGYPDFAVQPDLAESWTVSPDGLVYTFTLRQGVTWQDGQPFDVNDIKFTYELVTDPAWPGALDSYFSVVLGAREKKAGTATEITGLRVIDERTVEFTLTQPDTLFIASAVSRQRVLPRHLLEGQNPADIDKTDFARKPVYTGPYIVEEWRAGEGITFRANSAYFGGAPAVETIIARFIPDAATAIAELQSGGIQASLVAPDQFDQFVGNPDFTTQELPGLRIIYLQFDLTLPIFQDPRVRKAFSHSIDRDTVIQALYLNRADPAINFIPDLSPYANPNVTQYPFDTAAADALLTEAGWTPGEDGVRVNAAGERLAFQLTVPVANRQDGLAIQPFLQEIGAEVEIIEQGAGQNTGPLRTGEYQAAIGAWNNFIIDPRADLQRTFQNPRPTDSSGYRNDQVDQLFLEARGSLDPQAEIALYHQIAELVAQDEPYVFLWRQHDLLVASNQLTLPAVQSLSELYARLPEWQATS